MADRSQPELPLQAVAPQRRRRSILAAGLVLAGLGLGLAGCGRPKPERRQLQVWTLDLAPKFNDTINGAIAAWERQHPEVDVVWTDVPWGSVERKLLAAVFARTAPDVVNLNPLFAANLASKGGLLPLDPLLPPGAEASYLPRLWQAGRSAGPDGRPQQFTVPWYLTVRITLANTGLLRQAGYTAPPRRWEEVPAYAEAVKRKTGRYALFVTVVPDDSAELLESMVQMEVTLLDGRQRAAFNSPAGRRAFAFWTDLYRRGLLPREVVSQGYRRAIELYQSGELAQVGSGAEFLRSIQTNAPRIAAATRPFPPLTGASGDANVAVMNLAVPKQTRLPREALSLALFLTDATNQARFAEQARVLPSSKQALRQLEANLRRERPATPNEALVQQARLLSADTLERARVLVPASPGVKRLQAIVYTQLQRAMLGQLSSDAALAEAERQWNAYATARWP
ncbi:extracellular solute-binding protein [Vulcanococcus limneticus Candia 3F8]|uniref:extracellular solute-binding protein n=1 Tax=Vulcanococcus limneticus TaxID=2170428 RepID=UPI000B9930D9|nr:extracellular solute-binding protein [Vulcanococcus limneticus]MCP9792897.1 extracellular solute-binding protein [Vulcanococcus limneticus MW73D5]MCP9894882.1 extracellular solute-binding protein [Vulcanococcus limneticus Candia 3F8]MCP9898327.1 extracellular solute-binding protein [Vulcanococcus limneticus Candia 3B3]